MAGLESSVLDNSILLENGTITESVGKIAENSDKAADFSSFGLPIREIRLYAKENIHNSNADLRFLKNKPKK